MHDPLHSSHCCLILLRTNTVTSQTLHCVLSQFAVLGRIQSTEGDIIFALWVQVGVSVFPCCDESVFLPDLALCVGSAFWPIGWPGLHGLRRRMGRHCGLYVLHALQV